MSFPTLAAGAWTPATPAGLVAWYFADPAYLTLDGTVVDAWLDRSGNGHTLTPTEFDVDYEATGWNGNKPCVRFNDNDQATLETASAGLAEMLDGEDKPHTVFLTVQVETDDGGNTFVRWHDELGSALADCRTGTGGQLGYTRTDDNAQTHAEGGGIALGTTFRRIAYVFGADGVATDLKTYVDADLDIHGDFSSVDEPSGFTRFEMGETGFKFRITECAIYNRALTQQEWNAYRAWSQTVWGGSAAAWSPNTPGNVLGWYYASATYCFEDTGGTDPCEDTDGVARWSDRSAAGNHLTQATAGSRPIFDADGWNGTHPAVDFDGSNDFLARTTGTLLSTVDGDDQPFTVFATLQFDDAGTTDRSLLEWHDTGGTGRSNVRTGNTSTGRLRYARRDAAASEVDSEAASGDLGTGLLRVAYIFHGTTWSAYVGATKVVNGVACNVGDLGTFNEFWLGRGDSGFANGRIAELVIYAGDKEADYADYRTYSAAEFGG